MYKTKEIKEDVTVDQLIDSDFGIKLYKKIYDKTDVEMKRESLSFDKVIIKKYFRLDFHFFNELNPNWEKISMYHVDFEHYNNNDAELKKFSQEYRDDLCLYGTKTISRCQIPDSFISEMGQLALVIPPDLNDYYQTPLKSPSSIIFFLKMPFMTIFYVPSYNHLSITPSEKTNAYMNKKWEELSEIELTKLMEKDDKKDENVQRTNALYKFKKKHNVRETSSDFTWIVSTPQNRLEKYFRISPQFEELMLRCCWLECKKRRGRIIRLLHLIIYLNCPYQHQPSAQFTARTKKIKKNSIKNPKMSHEPDYDAIYTNVRTHLMVLVDSEKKHVKEISGRIEFWVMLNCVLFHLTNFSNHTTVLSWRGKYDIKTVDKHQSQLISFIKLLALNDFYMNGTYKERSAEKEDLRLYTNRLDDSFEFMKRKLRCCLGGSIPFIIIGDSICDVYMTKNFFEVHGQLSDID